MNGQIRKRGSITPLIFLLLTIGACAPAGQAGQAAKGPANKTELGKPKARVTYHDDNVEVALSREKSCWTEPLGWKPCGEAPMGNTYAVLQEDTRIIVPLCKGTTDAQGVVRFSQSQCDDLTDKPVPESVYLFFNADDGTREAQGLVRASGDPIALGKIEPYRSQNAPANVAKTEREQEAKRKADDAKEEAKKKAWREAELERLKPACQGGDKIACVQADFVRNQIGCKGGNGQACFAIATDLDRRIRECPKGLSSSRDKWCPDDTTFVRLDGKKDALQAACDLHYAPACQALPEAERAALQELGSAPTSGGAPGKAPALPNFVGDSAALKTRCTSGDNGACAVLGFVTRCQQGNAEGCDSTGNVYLSGTGVTKDLNKTKTYWIQACTMEATRCAGYGIRFQNTPGFQQNAQVVFDMGCQGDASQCVTVGALFLQGSGGVPRDTSKARAYFKRACDAGVAAGCQALQVK